MTSSVLTWISFVLSVILIPILVPATIRKTKARLQNRRGPRLFQPLYDLCKLCSKGGDCK